MADREVAESMGLSVGLSNHSLPWIIYIFHLGHFWLHIFKCTFLKHSWFGWLDNSSANTQVCKPKEETDKHLTSLGECQRNCCRLKLGKLEFVVLNDEYTDRSISFSSKHSLELDCLNMFVCPFFILLLKFVFWGGSNNVVDTNFFGYIIILLFTTLEKRNSCTY